MDLEDGKKPSWFSQRQTEGDVRALLTIVLVVGVMVFYAWKSWVPPDLLVMASTAFGYYFGQRSAIKNGASK